MRFVLIVFFVFIYVSSAATQADEKSPEVNALLDSAFQQLNAGDYALTEQLIAEARSLLGTKTRGGDYLKMRYTEANLYLSMWQYDKANPILIECLDLALQRADSAQLLRVYSALSVLKGDQSLHGAALMYNEKALSYFTGTDSMPYYALLLNISHVVRGRDPKKALQQVTATKDYYERGNQYQGLGITLNNIGEMYRDLFKDHVMAEKHYRKAMAINKAHGFKGGLASNYLNMALNFNESNQVDSSHKYIDLTLNLRKEMGDVGGLAIVYNTLGRIHLFNGDATAARNAYSRSIQISEKYDIYPGVYYGNLGLGQTYFEMGAHTLAKTYFEIALKVAKELGTKNLISDAYMNLYRIEKEDGNYKAALDYFETYSTYTDSLSKVESESDMAELKTLYETDLANKENMILKANQLSQSAELERRRLMTIGLWVVLGLVLVITVILSVGFKRRSKLLKKEAVLHQQLQSRHETVQIQKEELKELNDLKNSIFSVLGHDLRAPLTSISSLVGLMNSGDLDPEEFVDLTRYLDQETKAGLISLQNILIWSQAKAGAGKPQIENLPVAPIVENCVENSRRQIESKQLQIDTQWEYARMIPADPNQFKSIVFNLLSNAIKFSPKGGKIVMRTHKDAEGLYFTVINSGQPISQELIAHIADSNHIISHRGTMGEKGTGIGLRIVSDFAKLHGGFLHLRAGETGGTEATVFFPFRSSEPASQMSFSEVFS